DKTGNQGNRFYFKHHYITASLDSEIVCSLFEAMNKKSNITLETINRHKDRVSENHVVPLRIMSSVQSGRQYLMAYIPRSRRVASFRTDNILSVKTEEPCPLFDEHRAKLDEMQKHMWGVSTQGRSDGRTEHVEFTVRYADNEQHIPKRLEREKRCGFVKKIGSNAVRFSADVFDASELIPWIRSFLCRITDVYFSDAETEKLFRDDVYAMYSMYGIEEGGDDNAVQ
ncbi:MAG: WYL domain-containing protein, partial [Clostridia bacterium]|nr:WYL domain-containing protein [Clostridia bacterium]